MPKTCLSVNKGISMHQSQRVSIIIVARDTVEKTERCLASVRESTYPNFRIIVVDNGSKPTLTSIFSSSFPDVEFIQNPDNLGFAVGCNQGLKYARAQGDELFFILNNDAYVAADALSNMVSAFDNRPELGIVTAKIYYTHTPERIWTVGERISNWTYDVISRYSNTRDIGQWEDFHYIDYAPFCGILMNRAVLESVGFLDESFFAYYEDMDYCVRTRKAEFKLGMEPRAHIYHDVASTSGGMDSPAYRYWMGQSTGRYFRKHCMGFRMVIVFPLKCYSLIRNTIELSRSGNWKAIAAYWHGWILGWTKRTAKNPLPKWLMDTKKTGR